MVLIRGCYGCACGAASTPVPEDVRQALTDVWSDSMLYVRPYAVHIMEQDGKRIRPVIVHAENDGQAQEIVRVDHVKQGERIVNSHPADYCG